MSITLREQRDFWYQGHFYKAKLSHWSEYCGEYKEEYVRRHAKAFRI